MKLKQLITDEDAVSPVIGVILMVAITVILAAVIGTFVLGLGDQVTSSAPQVSFSFETTTDAKDCSLGGSGTKVRVTHDGGDELTATNVDITDGTAKGMEKCGFSSAVTAGDSGVVETKSGNTVRVVWTNPSSDSTNTIGKFEVP